MELPPNIRDLIITILIVLIIVFLLIRELNCWYWKINERIKLQKDTNFLLRKILNKLNNDDFSVQLTDEEKKLSDQIEKNITHGEKIIVNIISREIKKVSPEQWAFKYNKDGNWVIIHECK